VLASVHDHAAAGTTTVTADPAVDVPTGTR